MSKQQPIITVIEHGDVYTPEPIGVQPIMLVQDRIAKIGPFDPSALRMLDLPYEIVDARGCIVAPGLIDPHEHLIGAGGEEGFASRMPEVRLEQLISAGVTTVVGCLGTDITTRHGSSLLAKARQLTAQGLTAFIYTGGFPVPTPTITASIIDDLVLLDLVIGVGELAIADNRSVEPTLQELSKLVSAAYLGGMLSGKAGITHFHLGPGPTRLSLLHRLLDEHDIPPEQLYATHITRSEALLDDAIALAKRGAYVDMDTTEEGLGRWLRYYFEHDGDPERLTVSSDAHTPSGSPEKLYQQFVSSVCDDGLALERVLPCVTLNTARALKLPHKGRIAAGMDADLVVVKAQTLELVHVFARGRQLLRDGRICSID